jgi:hypothetical protein
MTDGGAPARASAWADHLKTPLDRREGLEAEITVLLGQIDRLWVGVDRTQTAPGTPLDPI